MKTLFIDCGMGAAGDMLTAALLEVHPDRDGFIGRFHGAGIPETEMRAEAGVSCGVKGTRVHMIVLGQEEHAGDAHEPDHDHHHEHGHHEHEPDHEHDHHHHHHDHDHDHHHEHEHHHHDHDHGHHHEHEHHHHHHHTSMRDVDALIDGLHLEEAVKEDIRAVYRLIADAESQVHGVPVTEIHFHEVGTMDALADITAVCMLMRELKPDEVVASPVATGYGLVRCAHGILPVPAPATALLLKGIPAYAGDCKGELCTPTGAALLKHFVSRFSEMPLMRVEKAGYGIGSKEFAHMNAVRVLFGETDDEKDRVAEFFFNVDDMTGEDIGFATERLFEAGALEVYTTPVFMKKNRPGILFSVMCREADKAAVLHSVFHHTTTIGVRETHTMRHVLQRETLERQTPYGPVREKKVSGFGVTRTKAEYDDLVRIAKERELSLEEVRRSV